MAPLPSKLPNCIETVCARRTPDDLIPQAQAFSQGVSLRGTK